MKIKFLKSVACFKLGKVFVVNDIEDIEDDRANDFIKSGIAIEMKEDKPKRASKKALK